MCPVSLAESPHTHKKSPHFKSATSFFGMQTVKESEILTKRERERERERKRERDIEVKAEIPK